jgi:hypothetical protein
MALANGFLKRHSYYVRIHEHLKHAHRGSSNCDYIAKTSKRSMTFCQNKCVLATKTFKPLPLKNMAAFVHMVSTKKYHVHDLYVKEPGIIIKSIDDATKFFKMISKPIRQLCSCEKCNNEILSPHYCNICKDFGTFQYLYNTHPRSLSLKVKIHIQSILYLTHIGKFLEKSRFETGYFSFMYMHQQCEFLHSKNCQCKKGKTRLLCSYMGAGCNAISCDMYIERFPPPNRYSCLEDNFNRGGDVKLIPPL